MKIKEYKLAWGQITVVAIILGIKRYFLKSNWPKCPPNCHPILPPGNFSNGFQSFWPGTIRKGIDSGPPWKKFSPIQEIGKIPGP